MKKYNEIGKIEYKGPESKDPFSFKYYNFNSLSVFNGR